MVDFLDTCATPYRFRVVHEMNRVDCSWLAKELRSAATRFWRVQDIWTGELYVWAQVPKESIIDIEFLQSWDLERFFLVYSSETYCAFCDRMVRGWPIQRFVLSTEEEQEAFQYEEQLRDIVTTLGLDFWGDIIASDWPTTSSSISSSITGVQSKVKMRWQVVHEPGMSTDLSKCDTLDGINTHHL